MEKTQYSLSVFCGVLLFFVAFGCFLPLAEGAELRWREQEAAIVLQIDSTRAEATRVAFTMAEGDCFKLQLYHSGGTGYEWQLLNKEDLQGLELLGQFTEPVEKDTLKVGGKARTEFMFRAKGKSREETLIFSLQRPWEFKGQAAKTVTCQVLLQ